MKRRRRQLARLGAQRTALPGEDNYPFFDRYSVGHAAFGVIFGLARLPWWATLGAALGFDILIERPLKDAWPELFPNPTQDTWMNIVGDAIAFMAGWGFANILPHGTPPTNTTLPE